MECAIVGPVHLYAGQKGFGFQIAKVDYHLNH